jgi:hypothetical protein
MAASYQPLQQFTDDSRQSSLGDNASSLGSSSTYVHHISASRVALFAVWITAATLVTSWIVYFITIDEITHLPALSETGILWPSKFIFTSGLIFGSSLFTLLTCLMYLRLRQADVLQAWSASSFSFLKFLQFASTVFGVSAIVFLILLAAVTLDDDFFWHQVFAGLFFLSAILQSACVFWIMRKHYIQLNLLHIVRSKRRALFAAVFVWLVLPIVLSFGMNMYCIYDSLTVAECMELAYGPVGHSVHAILQYCLISSLLVAVASLRHDLAVFRISIHR